MVKLDFTRPTAADLQYIADNMWHEDVAELLAAGNESVMAALEAAVAQSHATTMASFEGTPLIVGGLQKSNILTRTGVPWMLTTTQSKIYRREFMSYSRRAVAEMLDECDLLVNYVHDKNQRSIKWLRALGFVIHPAVKNATTGELFHRFTLSKEG